MKFTGTSTDLPTGPTNTTIAYVGAPRIGDEIGWVIHAAKASRSGEEPDRELLLRKAAVCDRIALEEAATGCRKSTAHAAFISVRSALRLIRHDSDHQGLSFRGAELVTATDYREYVRQEYRAWSLARLL